MKAIILVAGMGTRLKPLTDKEHKCLTKVNGKEIIFNALEKLNDLGIKETILVVGYLADQVKKRIGDSFGNMKIKYIINDIYDKTNTSESLWRAVKKLNSDDILILEGDVFFDSNMLKQLTNDKRSDLTVVEKYKPTLDGSFVDVKNDIVIDWIHKKQRASDFVIETKYKTVNIHKFSKSFCEKTLIPILKKHVEERNGTEPIEFVMKDIVTNTNSEIGAFEVGNIKWFEIDDVNDLAIAEKIFK